LIYTLSLHDALPISDITGMAYTVGYCSIPQFRAFQCSPVNGDSLASFVSFLVASGIFAAAGTIIFWTSKSLFRRRGVITGIALRSEEHTSELQSLAY